MNNGSKNDPDGTFEWDQWLAQHAPRLLLFARLQARCEADAWDLVQDAVVESWRQSPEGSPPPLGLVFATIRHRAIDLARREDRRMTRETTSHQDTPADWFDSGVEDRERSRLIQDAMKHLPEIHRDVITLKVWGGLTFEEIAGVLEIPANTAASRYRYGLAELKKLTKEVFA